MQPIKLLSLEPDVGMPEKDAHRFFQQLVGAVVREARLCVCVCVDHVSSLFLIQSNSHFMLFAGVPPRNWYHPQGHQA